MKEKFYKKDKIMHKAFVALPFIIGMTFCSNVNAPQSVGS